MIRFVIIACCLTAMTTAGCGWLPRPALPSFDPVAPTVGEATKAAGQSPEQAVDERIRMLTRELAAANADKAHLATDAQQKRILILQRVCLGLAALGMLGTIASAALFFVPTIAGKAAGIALPSAALFVASLIMYRTVALLIAAMPWLLAGGAILLVGMVVLFVRHIFLQAKAGKIAPNYGDLLESMLKTWNDPSMLGDILKTAKAAAADEQDKAGVRNLIAAMRDKPKPDPEPVAP